jgi:hypothetical protein
MAEELIIGLLGESGREQKKNEKRVDLQTVLNIPAAAAIFFWPALCR